MNANAPLVSVIIPVYNVRPYLEKCLDSVLNQTFSNIEVILINDGSTDSSAEICEIHAARDKRIKFISKKNEGQGATRNLGVSLAEGKYFIFLDPDDWFEKNCIELLYETSEKHQVDIVSCDINYVYQQADGTFSGTVSRLRLTPNNPFNPLTDKSVINKARAFLWGKLFRTEFYRSLKIHQPEHPYEDMCIMPVIVARATSIFHVQQPLLNYFRNRPNNTVDNFALLPYILTSLNELIGNFKRYELFDLYYEELKMLSYSHVRVALRKMETIAHSNGEQAIVLKGKLYDFMNNNFPEWINLFEKKYLVIGNRIIKKALLNLIANENQVDWYSSYDQLEEMVEADYVFLDSLSSNVESEAQNVICLIKDTDSDEKSSTQALLENALIVSIMKCSNEEDESWNLSDEILRTFSSSKHQK